MTEKGPRWLRKKGMGKKQPILFGSIFLGIAFLMIIVSIILVLFVDMMIGIIIGSQTIIPVIFSLVFYTSLLKKDYYHNYAYLMFGKENVRKEHMLKFMDWFLDQYKLDAVKKRDKKMVQYTWWFSGRYQGHIFIICSGKQTLAAGIKDQKGNGEDLIQDFILMLNTELNKKYGEFWWKGILD